MLCLAANACGQLVGRDIRRLQAKDEALCGSGLTHAVLFILRQLEKKGKELAELLIGEAVFSNLHAVGVQEVLFDSGDLR